MHIHTVKDLHSSAANLVALRKSKPISRGHASAHLFVGSTVEIGRLLRDSLRISDYTAILESIAEKRVEEALQVVDLMDHQNIPVSRDIIYCLLQGCTKERDLKAARRVHSLMVSSRLDSISVLGDHLIRLFAFCGSLEEANQAFSNVFKPTVYTWNSIISAHAKLGTAERALELYSAMQLSGIKPDRVTFLCVVKACGSVKAIGQGRLMHDEIIRSDLEMHVGVGNMLVDMYAKCGSIEEAFKVFTELPDRDVVSWGAMMTGYSQQGRSLAALELFEQMQQKGIVPNKVAVLCTLKACGNIGAIEQGRQLHGLVIKSGLISDIAIGNLLVDMYAKCGNLGESRKVFDNLHMRDVKLWGTIISGCSMFGNFNLVEQCFADMQRQGLKPDNVIFTSILSSCSHAGLLEKGHQYFQSIAEEYCMTPSIEHYNCMVDLLGRAGRLGEAIDVLNAIPVPPNIVGWISLLTSCKTYSNMELGRKCFEEVIQLEPTEGRGYMLMSSIYADAARWDEVDKVQELRKSASAWRKPGMSWVEIENKLHEFTVGGRMNLQINIFMKLKALNKCLMGEGHVPQSELVVEPTLELDEGAALSEQLERMTIS